MVVLVVLGLTACRSDGPDAEAVIWFDVYDIVHSAEAPRGDRQGRITPGQSDGFCNVGDVVWLERDGRFMATDKCGNWLSRWIFAPAFGSFSGTGIKPVEGRRYACRRSGVHYVAEGGRLIPDEPQMPSTATVMSWNIGCFTNGNNSAPALGSPDEYFQLVSDFSEPFALFSPDLIGLCEFVPEPLDGYDLLTDLFGGYKGRAVSWLTRNYLGKALIARSKIYNLKQIVTPDGILLEGETLLCGKPFVVAVAHCSWARTHRNDFNLMDLRMISERYRYMPNVILMGDFNVYEFREEESWRLFTDAGFTLANGGRFGSHITTYNSELCSPAIDNIMVKGAEIIAVQTLQKTPEGLDPRNPLIADERLWDAANLSDHFPLFATLSLR